MTLLELLRSSFRLIGVLHEGQGPNADDITDSLFVLNSMLEAWSIERLFIYTIQPSPLTLRAGQQTYGVGPGSPDFDMPRPIKIEQARMLTAGSTGPFELPLEIINYEQWAAISIKSTLSTIPTRMYNDNQWPIANISFWPVPSTSVQAVLYGWQALQTGFTSVSQEVSFPPGYADAIRYNLATRLAPEWSVSIRPDVIDFATKSKAAIKTINKPTMYLGCDVALMETAPIWNWLTGSSHG